MMHARRKREGEEEDAWLVTYADMVTLLLCFFIILFALSSPEPQKYASVATQLREHGFFNNEIPTEDPYENLKEHLEMSLGASGYDQFIAVSKNPKFVSMELSSGAFFEPGKAQFKPEALQMLQLVTQQLLQMKDGKIYIEVGGYTDSAPIATEQFPSNWELSAARASTVVRYLISQGFPKEKLRAVGFADTKPKAPEHDTAGKPIPANQELNRRVVMKLIKNDDE